MCSCEDSQSRVDAVQSCTRGFISSQLTNTLLANTYLAVLNNTLMITNITMSCSMPLSLVSDIN